MYERIYHVYVQLDRNIKCYLIPAYTDLNRLATASPIEMSEIAKRSHGSQEGFVGVADRLPTRNSRKHFSTC